jgi:hypothetical protein
MGHAVVDSERHLHQGHSQSKTFLCLFGLLAAMKAKHSPVASVVFIVGLTFLAFAFYGSGFEADAWSVVLLGMGIVVRGTMRSLERRPRLSLTGAA